MLGMSFYIEFIIIENETITNLMNEMSQTKQIRVCSLDLLALKTYM